LRQKLKERRVALLGKKCWAGPNDETQPYEATQAAQAFADFTETVREMSTVRETAQVLEGSVVRDQEGGVSGKQEVKEERPEVKQEKDEVKEEMHDVNQEKDDKENGNPMEVLEDEILDDEDLEKKPFRAHQCFQELWIETSSVQSPSLCTMSKPLRLWASLKRWLKMLWWLVGGNWMRQLNLCFDLLVMTREMKGTVHT